MYVLLVNRSCQSTKGIRKSANVEPGKIVQWLYSFFVHDRSEGTLLRFSEIPLDWPDQTLLETRVPNKVRGLCLVGSGPVGPVLRNSAV